MARGTNSSKYIQSIGSQDVRQHVAFPARGAVREGFAVCCEWGFLFLCFVFGVLHCTSHPDKAASQRWGERQKGHTIVFSQCVKWDKAVYRFHTESSCCMMQTQEFSHTDRSPHIFYSTTVCLASFRRLFHVSRSLFLCAREFYCVMWIFQIQICWVEWIKWALERPRLHFNFSVLSGFFVDAEKLTSSTIKASNWYTSCRRVLQTFLVVKVIIHFQGVRLGYLELLLCFHSGPRLLETRSQYTSFF